MRIPADANVAVADDFDGPALDTRWALTCPGGGRVAVADSVLWLLLDGAQAGHYSDAQVDDYSGSRRARFRWRPPLRLEVRARAMYAAPSPRAPASPATEPRPTLRGTAGFGFWNYPVSLRGVPLRPPEAVWFFCASPPSNMALVPGSAGWGWKAQVIHARRVGAALALPPYLLAMSRARLGGNERAAAGWLRRLAGASEAHLAVDLRVWHEYVIEWQPAMARFLVDGAEALAVARPPRGPLGFVAWVDNQWALATPRGTLRFGTLVTERQWLELDWLRITPLA